MIFQSLQFGLVVVKNFWTVLLKNWKKIKMTKGEMKSVKIIASSVVLQVNWAGNQ